MQNNRETHILPENEIVNAIAQNAQWELNSRGNDVITLSYGRKDLMIVASKRDNSVITRVENMRESGQEENETTLLYTAAKKIMGQLAQKYKSDLKYTISTSDESMNAWAQSKGVNIFNLQPASDIRDDFDHHYRATIAYKPEE